MPKQIAIVKQPVFAFSVLSSQNWINSLFKHLDKRSSHLVRPSDPELSLSQCCPVPPFYVQPEDYSLHQNVIYSFMKRKPNRMESLFLSLLLPLKEN